jgi:hypothetical protein
VSTPTAPSQARHNILLRVGTFGLIGPLLAAGVAYWSQRTLEECNEIGCVGHVFLTVIAMLVGFVLLVMSLFLLLLGLYFRAKYKRQAIA